MNRQIKRFQNMYDVLYAKFDRLAKKFNFVQKKTKSPKDNGQLSDMLTLEGSGRRRNDTRPALRVSLKTLGIPVQTSYVEGQWHQT